MDGVNSKDQPWFNTVQNCELKAVSRKANRWCICELNHRSELDANWNQFVDDNANQMRRDVQECLSDVIAEQIIKGEVGAMANPDENADGHHLTKFTSEPFHCEERQELVVKGKCLNPVGDALFGILKSQLW